MKLFIREGEEVANKKKNNSSKFIFWVVGFVAICLGGLIFLSNSSNKEVALDYKDQPFLGEESASVSIVEFGDYKCPVCKNFNETFFPQIQDDLIDTGKAKFYFMNYSFINIDSKRSAKFAETVYQELGNDTFWQFHELLYDKQPEDTSMETKDVFTDTFLEETLAEIASEEETKKVVKAFQNGKADQAWDSDMKTANSLGVTGTPTLFINGKKFEGAAYEDFVEMVEETETGE
jgi:protein-disulfide isomerase